MSTTALMLALEIQPLSDLAAWPSVGVRLTALQAALAGGDGVAPSDVALLRVFARRWSALHPSLRRWYALHAASDERVAAALWYVLAAKTPHVGVYVAVRAAWLETEGCDPWLSLLPDLSHLAV